MLYKFRNLSKYKLLIFINLQIVVLSILFQNNMIYFLRVNYLTYMIINGLILIYLVFSESPRENYSALVHIFSLMILLYPMRIVYFLLPCLLFIFYSNFCVLKKFPDYFLKVVSFSTSFLFLVLALVVSQPLAFFVCIIYFSLIVLNSSISKDKKPHMYVLFIK